MINFGPESAPFLPSNSLLDRLLGEKVVDPQAVQDVVDQWVPILLGYATEDPQARPRWDHQHRTTTYVTEPVPYRSPLTQSEVAYRVKVAFGPRDITDESTGVILERIALEYPTASGGWLPFAEMTGKGSQRTADDPRDSSFMWSPETIAEQCPPEFVIPGSMATPQRNGSQEELFAFIDALKRVS